MKTNYLIILFTLFSHFSFCQTRDLEVTFKQNDDNTVDFYYSKTEYGTYTVQVTFNRLENAYTQKFVGTAKSKTGKLFTLKPINPKNGISFSYKYIYGLGEINPKINKSFVYLLPFKKGVELEMHLANNVYNTLFKTENPKNWTAFVFNIEVLDTVVSIRKGLVINIKDQFETDTISDFNSNKNKITIEHPDGTFATYSGFAKNGIFVKPGQTVYPHTDLGILQSDGKFKRYFLYLTLYYLSDEFVDGKSPAKLTYINPLFYSQEATEHLVIHKKYTSNITDEILFKEMTKRERKKYLENN